MNEPKLEELNNMRKRGIRPGVVVCIIKNKRLLMFHKKEYMEWQLPQGGIENGEEPQTAILREMTEELGATIVESFVPPFILFGSEELVFPEQRHGVKELKTDEGEDVLMKGKAYFFYIVNSSLETIDISATEYEDFFWVDYSEAMFLASQSKAVNKRKIIANAIDLLKTGGHIE